jgi:hypothetical protein
MLLKTTPACGKPRGQTGRLPDFLVPSQFIFLPPATETQKNATAWQNAFPAGFGRFRVNLRDFCGEEMRISP